MRSERCRTCAMSSSSSTTSTRAGRTSMRMMVSPVPARPGRFQPTFSEGSRSMATRSRTQSTRRKAPPRAGGKRPPARAGSTRRRPGRRGGLPPLEQRHADLLGLGLIAVAVFFAFVIWLGWDGGAVGDAAVEGFRWLVGGAHVAAPFVIMAAGALLVLRPVLPAVRPIRAGTVCLVAAVELGLSAGTFGLGPGGAHP